MLEAQGVSINWWFPFFEGGGIKGMKVVHEGIAGGHFGVEKSLGKLKEWFYWPGNYNDIHNWCSTCSDCVARKTIGPHRKAPLQPIVVGYLCK